MADVRPFHGLRFASSVVPDIGVVLSPPYDVIGSEDDRRLRDRHPNNVVRLELTTASVAGGPAGRYEEAARTLRAWRDAGILVREPEPAYYLHEATFSVDGREATRREIIAAVRLEPWARRVVLPHEQTFPRAKADRLRLLAATRANLSGILSFFQRGTPTAGAARVPGVPDAIDAAWTWAGGRAPEVAGTDSEGVAHALWVLTDVGLGAGLRAFFASRPLFIADGHHRYETALNYLADLRRAAGGALAADHPAGFVMMHLIAEDDPGLVILPLHRLVRGVGAGALSAVVQQVRAALAVTTVDGSDAGAVARAIRELAERGRDGQAFALAMRGTADIAIASRPATDPLPTAVPADRHASWRELDVVLVDAVVVRPLVAASGRHAEDVVRYTRDATDAVEQVRAGAADLAVLVNPTRPDQVAAVSLADERMPEKSTYFFPKAPTGLVLRPLDEPPAPSTGQAGPNRAGPPCGVPRRG